MLTLSPFLPSSQGKPYVASARTSPSTRRRYSYTGVVQEVLDVSNAVAAELAGMADGVLEALRDRLNCTIRLRGNQLTLEGDGSEVSEAREVIDELVEHVEGGHHIGAHTVDAVLGALQSAPDVSQVL